MISGGQLLAFTAAALVLILIPGPSVLFIVGRALAHGRRKAVLTALGNCLGAFTAAALVAVGVGALIQQSAAAFAIVKYVGAAYLVYLGVRAFGHRTVAVSGIDDPRERGRGPTALSVFEGFLVGVLNPKGLLFFLAVLPQFVDPRAGSATVQMLVLGAIFAGIAAVCDTAWGLAAAAARDLLNAPRPKRLLARAGGVSMIGLGVAAAAGQRA